MFFILLSIFAIFTPPIALSLRGPESGFSNDQFFNLERAHIYENTSTQVFANVGDSVQFECYASLASGGDVTVIWSRSKTYFGSEPNRNNLPLPNGEEYYIGNILQFPSVTPEQAGSYDCKAYNEHASSESRLYLLSIKSKPKVSGIEIEKKLNDDGTLDTIKLTVVVSSVPYSNVTWFQNNQSLNENPKYNIHSLMWDREGSILTITARDNDYDGTYRSVIKNEVGEIEYTFKIQNGDVYG